jgi:hypothetical protein
MHLTGDVFFCSFLRSGNVPRTPCENSFLSSHQRCLFARRACVLATNRDIAPRRGRRKIPPPRYSLCSACGPLSEHFKLSADKSLPLKHEYFLLGDQEDRCAAGRNRNCISDRLFATLRCGAGLQSLHGGEMDLCNAMEGRCPLRGTDYFARHNFCLVGRFRDCHGHMIPVVNWQSGATFTAAGQRIPSARSASLIADSTT